MDRKKKEREEIKEKIEREMIEIEERELAKKEQYTYGRVTDLRDNKEYFGKIYVKENVITIIDEINNNRIIIPLEHARIVS